MLEAFAAWRTVLHVSEWTGLSVGALAVIGLLVYLDPRLLKPAIAAAILVAVALGGVLYGDRTGRADVTAQWNDAKAAAEAAQAKRDADIGRELEQKYQPQLAELQQQADERKTRADAYERQILKLLSNNPAARSACELGAAARRLRRR